MDGLLTAENLPVILALILSGPVLIFIRDMVGMFRTWRKGASEKEKNILTDALTALDRCHHERDAASNERDAYRRMVGRRDYLLLKHGIKLPNDNGGAEDGSDGRSVGPEQSA